MNKQGYLVLVLVSVGLLSLLLRSLPFLFFGGRTQPPRLVKYIGRVLSPAAIAMLVVYCYAGEGVRQASGFWVLLSPYLAGLLTVVMQLRWRNPLVSILVGTALYMVLVR